MVAKVWNLKNPEILMTVLNRLKHRIRLELIKAKVSHKINIEDTIVLFSEPRSGSTWVMNLLQQIPYTAVIWEPEHPENGLVDKALGLNSDIQYIPKQEHWPEAEEEFRRIFNLHKLNKWSAEQSPFRNWMKSEQMIVKFVRASALMPWLLEQFGFNHRPIFLLRHPMAVVKSQIRAFFREHNSDKFNAWPPQPYPSLFEKHRDFLNTLQSNLEIRLAVWCLNNSVVLEEPKENFIRIHYEDILLTPEACLERLFKELEVAVPDGALQLIDKPSVTDFQKDLKDNSREQIEKWTGAFSKEELKKAQQILDYFGIDLYSAYDPYPVET
jgi:hypothetical protein